MAEGTVGRRLARRTLALVAAAGALGGCGRRASTDGTAASPPPPSAPAPGGAAPGTAGLLRVRLTVPTIT